MKTAQQLKIDDKTILVTNLDKILWTKPKITKADLIQYYISAAPYALRYWTQRPLTVTRYPNGIDSKGFYQKNCPKYAPDWIETYEVLTENRSINSVLCNDLATLLWLANQAVIEIHPTSYQIDQPDNPSYAIIDLDPTAPLGFSEAVEIALKIKVVLQELGLRGYPKTSGATGIHIYIPLAAGHTFKQTVKLVEFIGEILVKLYPDKVTSERLVKNRYGVYVDHLQNLPSKTIVGVYSLRPLFGAPVSTPVLWEELEYINPLDFTLLTLFQRLQAKGDLFAPVLTDRQSIEHLLPLL